MGHCGGRCNFLNEGLCCRLVVQAFFFLVPIQIWSTERHLAAVTRSSLPPRFVQGLCCPYLEAKKSLKLSLGATVEVTTTTVLEHPPWQLQPGEHCSELNSPKCPLQSGLVGEPIEERDLSLADESKKPWFSRNSGKDTFEAKHFISV